MGNDVSRCGMRFAWIVALAVALTMLTALAGMTAARASLPGADPALTRAPYLSDLTTTSVQVSWGTSGQTTGVVQYGPPGNCTAQSVIASKMGSPITINGVRECQNSVTVTGLSSASA